MVVFHLLETTSSHLESLDLVDQKIREKKLESGLSKENRDTFARFSVKD